MTWFRKMEKRWICNIQNRWEFIHGKKKISSIFMQLNINQS
jgi:hypothetical protein